MARIMYKFVDAEGFEWGAAPLTEAGAKKIAKNYAKAGIEVTYKGDDE